MDKKKISIILWFFSSIVFYITATINFTSDDSSMASTYFCLGSVCLCLGAAELNKQKKAKKEDKE